MSGEKRLSRLRQAEETRNAPVRLASAPKNREEGTRALAKVEGTRAEEVRGVRSVRPAREAWEKIAAPLRKGDGIRVLFFGITGKGKTTGLKDFLKYLLDEHLLELVFVHDVKYTDRQQYEGEPIYEADEFDVDNPPETYPAVRVLRRRNLDHIPSYDRAARKVVVIGNTGVMTALVGDEFSRALEEELKTVDGKDKPFKKGETMRLVCEGRGVHASHLAAKQLPQFTPSEISDQSDLVIFGLASKGVNHLLDSNTIDAPAGEVIPRLEVGQFVWQPSEGDFNGIVYQVPAP